MVAPFLILVVIPTLFAAAAIWDLARYTIPNAVPLALAVIFALAALTTGMAPMSVAAHVGVGAVALIAGFTLFAFGFVGGGDAKLFAAIILILGPGGAVPYTLLASVLGGALTISILWLRQMPLPAPLVNRGWVMRLHDPRRGVPYGVALSAAAFVLMPHGDLVGLISS